MYIHMMICVSLYISMYTDSYMQVQMWLYTWLYLLYVYPVSICLYVDIYKSVYAYSFGCNINVIVCMYLISTFYLTISLPNLVWSTQI